MRIQTILLCFVCSCLPAAAATPVYLDDRFELPPGFHIYRACGPEQSGGSYAMTFDGEGRLLVGDGNAVRRLSDKDNDGVFDSYEVIATGLGPRGPQGLLVYADRLYAVGGDGIQVFEGYRGGGPLVHKGRIGAKFNTGGDHDGHTIFRGHDGYLYFMAGNGAGIEDRRHITEESSPCLIEREASVFRISPDGTKWECIANGGRNPPSLGMNYVGELFSFDSDMEWHVGLPWYRPVRLNHWAIGGDQGWQEVGAYPPYFIDNLPGILDMGRGSPTWGVFYEHTQFPEKYRDAFIVCDYRWKRESNDQYHTTGRLVAFFLKRAGAGWKAAMEQLAKPKSGAHDAAGRLINFALVDVAVAPDGSLFVSDHNQGVWRIVYGKAGAGNWPTSADEAGGTPALRSQNAARLLDALIGLPQPAAEWSRAREQTLRNALSQDADTLLQKTALDRKRNIQQRLRALRLLSPNFEKLPDDFVKHLADDASEEMRGLAAWLTGLRGNANEVQLLLKLLDDADPFVRRRATEAATRITSPALTPALIERLNDPVRLVRYVAMIALAHRPTSGWLDAALVKPSPQVRMRALVTSLIRREPPADERVSQTVVALLGESKVSTEDRLDLLRVLALFQKPLQADMKLNERVAGHLLGNFPDPDRNLRWEQARLLGQFRCSKAFSKLLAALETEGDEVTRFHLAQALARLPDGWIADEEARALRWFLGTQRGWFAEFGAKGVEFPHFWMTVLANFGEHHRDALLRELSKVELAGQLGTVAINLLTAPPESGDTLIKLYRASANADVKLKILTALRKLRNVNVSAFFEVEYEHLGADDPAQAKLHGAILQTWAMPPVDLSKLTFLIYEGLFDDDEDVVRACANAIESSAEEARALMSIGRTAAGGDPQSELAVDLISRMTERRKFVPLLEKVLVTWSSQQRPGYKAGTEQKFDDAASTAAIEYWKNWYELRFKKKFNPVVEASAAEKSDEDVHKFLMIDSVKGDAARGTGIYETLQCQTCHGGGVTPGREGRFFGPDLAGATQRLSRRELADALVYPSKQVADRFKGYAVVLKDSTVLTGFITEQTDDAVTLVDREQVRRIPRSEVRSITPQSTSLMPDRLLNRLSWEEIRDLLAFLEQGALPSQNGGLNKK